MKRNSQHAWNRQLLVPFNVQTKAHLGYLGNILAWIGLLDGQSRILGHGYEQEIQGVSPLVSAGSQLLLAAS